MNDTLLTPTNALKEAWTRLTIENPKLRIRDAARTLGVSEAELLATGCGEQVTRLEADWKELFKELGSLGEVMALTRNDHAVHERKGEYLTIHADGPSGLVLGEEIDLRVFFSHWHLGFAVQEKTRDDLRRSLQFFDKDGTAVHKVYLQPEGNLEAFEALVEKYRSADQSVEQAVTPLPEPAADRPDGEIDFEALYNGWRRLEDTHDFFPLLKKHEVSRIQALRHAEADLATELAPISCSHLLEQAAAREVSIMVFVGSRGVIQIHTGPVHRIARTGPWINVLDPRFNLHLREDAVATAWIVRKPTRDGVVTSLEIFDAENNVIALFFGKRKPGIPESEEWRALVEEIASVHLLTA